MRARRLLRMLFFCLPAFSPAISFAAADDGGGQITIESPARNAIITSSAIYVSGTAVARSQDIGIVVNGVVAEIDLDHAGTIRDPFRWFAAVATEPGRVKLKARLKTPKTEDRDESEGQDTVEGTGPARVRFIDFVSSEHHVRIKASPPTGLAPLAVRFDLDTLLMGEIAQFETTTATARSTSWLRTFRTSFHSPTPLRACVS